MYYVYVLESQNDHSYYIGYTQGIEKRLKHHNQGRGRYTAKKVPWKLVYSEVYSTKREAILREREIKNKKSRNYIHSLIFS